MMVWSEPNLVQPKGLMTGVVMWITISAVYGRRKIPADLFGIPITALFALPTVRSIMPGAPFFGRFYNFTSLLDPC